LARTGHARSEHPFETAHSIPKIGDFLGHSRQIGRAVANPFIEQNDLAQSPYRVAIQAHAAAVSFPRRVAGLRLDAQAKLSATFL
jgi:hypothetical protein